MDSSVMFQYPYPTEKQKKTLSSVTGLNMSQINNWYVGLRDLYWSAV